MDTEDFQERYHEAVGIAEEQFNGVQTVLLNPNGWDSLVETDVIDHPYEQTVGYWNVVKTVDGEEIEFDDTEVRTN